MSKQDLENRIDQVEAEIAALRKATPTELEERLKVAHATITSLTTLNDSSKVAAAGVASALSDAQAKQAEIAGIASQAVAAKTQISDQQAVIATKSDHIQKAQEHADKVRGDLDRTLTAAQQQATATEGHSTTAKSAAEASNKILADIRATKGSADAELTAAAAARRQAEEAMAVAKALAEKSATIETRIIAYETELAKLKKESEAQLATIVGLLPGATAAGLASAFDTRRQSFLKPSSRWQWLFIGALLAIVALTGSALWNLIHAGTAPSYDELFRMWLARAPVMIALVWLALHASHEAGLAKRLEEDYGYKAAIAACFEGFKKQMAEVGATVQPGSPLAHLLENTLRTIAAPPGRIYDKHALAATPADEAKQLAKTVNETLTKVQQA
jgi:hypothetical protein